MSKDQNIESPKEEGNDELPFVNRESSNVNELTQPQIEQSEIPLIGGIINSKLQTAQMEVHHHPKVEKKNFKEYFLEFIMIFLAVTLGFFAENIRESISKSEVERSNIESFIINLQADSLDLLNTINENQNTIALIDSLAMMPLTSVEDTSFQKQFFNYATRLIYTNFFFPDESAFEQMQSSGTLRMKHPGISDSILKYHTQNKRIQYQREEVHPIFVKSGDKLVLLADYSSFIKGVRPTLNATKQQVVDYINYKIGESVAISIYVRMLNTQLANIRVLIPFLKKEYGIK